MYANIFIKFKFRCILFATLNQIMEFNQLKYNKCSELMH